MSGVIPSMEERFARVARIEAGARQLQKELGYWTPSLVAALLSEDFDTVGRFAVAATCPGCAGSGKYERPAYFHGRRVAEFLPDELRKGKP